MTSPSEEEDDRSGGSGRPNLWWAQQREANERDVHKGEHRAVRMPKAGSQSVMPEDTTGSYEECWCGLPFDHDWVGKASGRKHPKKVDAVTVAKVSQDEVEEHPYIAGKDLNGYDGDVAEIVKSSINTYGLKYRRTGQAIVLYPKDGSQAKTVHKNIKDRALKGLRIWYVKHVIEVAVPPAFVKDKDVVLADLERRDVRQQNRVTNEQLRKLAEEKNGPEHEVKEPITPTPEVKPQSTEVAAAKEPRTRRPTVTTHSTYIAWENPEGEWGSFRRKSDGVVNPRYERLGATNDVRCVEPDCGWVGTGAAVSGHDLNHDPSRQEGIWGTKAQDKKRQTIQTNVVSQKVKEALAILHDAVGWEAEVKVDTQQVEKLEAQVAALIKERDEMQAKYLDLRAKLDLLRDL